MGKMAISRPGPVVAIAADSSESRAASSREDRGDVRREGPSRAPAWWPPDTAARGGPSSMQQSPGNQAVPGLTQLYRPSAGARRDLVPTLLGVLAQLYMPLAAYRKRDPLADGRCHTPPRLACAREAPPRSRAAEVAISCAYRHIERDCPGRDATRNPPGQQAPKRIIGGTAAGVAGAAVSAENFVHVVRPGDIR